MIELDRSPKGYLEAYVSGPVVAADIRRAASWLDGALRADTELALYIDLHEAGDPAPGVPSLVLTNLTELGERTRLITRIALVVNDGPTPTVALLVRRLPPHVRLEIFGDADRAAARRWLSGRTAPGQATRHAFAHRSASSSRLCAALGFALATCLSVSSFIVPGAARAQAPDDASWS